jgi:hypothetical protein
LKKIAFISLLMILLIPLFVNSVGSPCVPSGDGQGRGLYGMYNFTNISCVNLHGNLNASYIQNAPWVINTTQSVMNLGFYNSTYLDPFLMMGGF